jgi:hypothetical protein
LRGSIAEDRLGAILDGSHRQPWAAAVESLKRRSTETDASEQQAPLADLRPSPVGDRGGACLVAGRALELTR